MGKNEKRGKNGRKKEITGKRGGKREEKKRIVIKKRENLLIVSSFNIGPYNRIKNREEIKKITRGGGNFLVAIIFSQNCFKVNNLL